MVIVDVNTLVYAFRVDTPMHDQALAWLTDRLSDPGEELVIPDLVWVGFIRISTNPRIFYEPSSITAVVAFVQAIVTQPTYRSVPGLGISDLLDLMVESNSRGDLVTDTYIASLARQLGAPVATFDRDFRRFDDLPIIHPTTPS